MVTRPVIKELKTGVWGPFHFLNWTVDRFCKVPDSPLERSPTRPIAFWTFYKEWSSFFQKNLT